jgi:hypothetical protein
MPVNMDPSKKRRRPQRPPSSDEGRHSGATSTTQPIFGEETEADREKELAEAELKNLWDATEVIDMDKV